MFTVEGFLNGVYYTATVGGSRPATGIVGGSRNIVGYLAGREGDHYAATPTGPFGDLNTSDPESALGALLGWTEVRAVTGDAPDILRGQTSEPGVVY